MILMKLLWYLLLVRTTSLSRLCMINMSLTLLLSKQDETNGREIYRGDGVEDLIKLYELFMCTTPKMDISPKLMRR